MKLTEYDWMASPDCEAPGADEALLISRRDDIDVIGTVEDAEADYSYDDWALIRLDGAYWVLSTSGCSCPSPRETWRAEVGPLSLDEVRTYFLDAAGEKGFGVTKHQHAEFMALVDLAVPS